MLAAGFSKTGFGEGIFSYGGFPGVKTDFLGAVKATGTSHCGALFALLCIN